MGSNTEWAAAQDRIHKHISRQPRCGYCGWTMQPIAHTDSEGSVKLAFRCQCPDYLMDEQSVEIELLGVGI